MNIRFTTVDGYAFHWDGVLWSSEGTPKAAAALNQGLLPEAAPHDSIVRCAQRLLESSGFRGVTYEILDDSGWPEEWLRGDVGFGEEGVAGGAEERHPSEHDGTTETGAQGSPEAGKEVHGRRGLRPGRPDARANEEHLAEIIRRLNECRSENEFELWDEEWAALIAWADDRNLILTGPGPLRDHDTKEHGVRFEEADQLWWKYTKPSRAGFNVDWKESGVPYIYGGLPSDYFARLRRQNELFSDSIRVEGLWRNGTEGWRIVTTQPHVAGTDASMEEIGEGMKALGFVKLPWEGVGYETAEAWRIGRLCVWDLHPGNVALLDSGLIVPFDVIITPLPDGFPPCHFHP